MSWWPSSHVWNPLKLALSGRPFIENYRWEPERGTRFLVVDRVDGALRAELRAPAVFSFHHVNAFERDGEVVVDLCEYEDASIIRSLYLDRLRGGGDARLPQARLRRWRLPLGGGGAGVAVGETLAAGVKVELPRIDYRRRNMREYRYVWATSTRLDGPARFLDALVRVDVTD